MLSMLYGMVKLLPMGLGSLVPLEILQLKGANTFFPCITICKEYPFWRYADGFTPEKT